MNPLANMFISIVNGSHAHHESVIVPFSKFKMEIVKFLQDNGFIKEATRRGKKNKRTIEITLRYDDGRSAINGIKMISKQSQRIYGGWQELRSFRGTEGLTIVSTSKGLLSAREAQKQKTGGEIIANIW